MDWCLQFSLGQTLEKIWMWLACMRTAVQPPRSWLWLAWRKGQKTRKGWQAERANSWWRGKHKKKKRKKGKSANDWRGIRKKQGDWHEKKKNANKAAEKRKRIRKKGKDWRNVWFKSETQWKNFTRGTDCLFRTFPFQRDQRQQNLPMLRFSSLYSLSLSLHFCFASLQKTSEMADI